MSARQMRSQTYTGMRGRDDYPTFPSLVPKTRALEMLNVDNDRAGFARKRGGASNIFSGTTGEAFTGVLSFLGGHVPGNDVTAAELWGADDAATPVVQRLAGGTAWSTPTLKDNVSSNSADIVGVSFKGRYYLAYKSAESRLHVWDGSTVRRAGLATPAAATVANTGAGAYAATARYYRVAYAEYSGSTLVRMSELSASVSFTPSGAGTAALVTKPAALNEGETHWILYGSPDDATFEKLATTVIATTTYDDSTAPADYTGDAPPLAGTHTNWTSVKYLLATDDHLIGAGSWASGGLQSRVSWSGVTNQTGVLNEDESVMQTTAVSNYVDLGEGDGSGDITGLGGPLDGRPLVFKRKQVWRLVPTGIDAAFYRPVPVFKGSGIGCIRHQTIINAIDAAGRPAIYWLDETGPYRIGSDGPQSLVDNIQGLWSTVNLAASSVVAHGVYHPARHQVWWWVATGSSNDPDTKIVFDVRLGRVYEDGRVGDGWYQHTGLSAAARCSCLFSRTLAASMSRDLAPHVGRSTGTTILKCDTSDTDDAGTAFQAYVDLPDTHYGGLDKKCTLHDPILIGAVGSATLSVIVVEDYGLQTRTAVTASLAATGSETRRATSVEGAEAADCGAVRLRIGDASAVASAWTLDAVVVRYETREALG